MDTHTLEEKNRILTNTLLVLQTRLPNSAWLASGAPCKALRAECALLASDAEFMGELRSYLRGRTVLRRAITQLFTHISMAARARWDDAPAEIRSVVARGWFLGRWLPTFLIIDGPIGRFFLNESSPLARRLGTTYPVLSAARDLLNEKTFRALRNAFAHWGFDWEVVGRDSFVVAYDWEHDLPTARLHQEEADAFHICAYAIIEQIDDVLLSGRSPSRDAA